MVPVARVRAFQFRRLRGYVYASCIPSTSLLPVLMTGAAGEVLRDFRGGRGGGGGRKEEEIGGAANARAAEPGVTSAAAPKGLCPFCQRPFAKWRGRCLTQSPSAFHAHLSEFAVTRRRKARRKIAPTLRHRFM